MQRFSSKASLEAAGDPMLEAMLAQARNASLESGEFVFHSGAACENYLLIVSGTVRVQMVSDGGRVVTLYRIGSGEACLLTTSCLMSSRRYPAEGLAEGPVRALAVSRPEFETTMDRSSVFRRFVFDGFAARLSGVIQRMEAVTFGAVDDRLIELLLADHRAGATTTATHQEIATELWTAREVVSRHLKRLEAQGLVELGRGRVRVLDAARLANYVVPTNR